MQLDARRRRYTDSVCEGHRGIDREIGSIVSNYAGNVHETRPVENNIEGWLMGDKIRMNILDV